MRRRVTCRSRKFETYSCFFFSFAAFLVSGSHETILDECLCTVYNLIHPVVSRESKLGYYSVNSM